MAVKILTDVPLSEHTTYKIGGPARFFAEAKEEKEIAEIIEKYGANADGGKKIFILGGGANVLFSDKGYDGLVLKISFSKMEIAGENTIRAGAGAKLIDVVKFSADHDLSGFEWAAGIPGYFGGAIRGNAGAFGGEIKDALVSVRSIRIEEPEKTIERENDGKIFGYRTSIFKKAAKDEIILSADIRLSPGKEEDIRKKMELNMEYRKERQPLEWPSAGSTFKNVDVSKLTENQKKELEAAIKTDPMPVIPAAFLIAQSGLKGKKIGGAQISEKHPNFFINTGNAKAEDVKELIKLTKKTVKKKFGIEMEEEIQIVE
jgi:UDP-N-acetylmuramate dehydrogenase